MSGPARNALAICGGGAAVFALLGLGLLLAGQAGAGEFRAILAFGAAAVLLLLGLSVFSRVRPGRRARKVEALAPFNGAEDAMTAVIRLQRPVRSASDFFRVYSVGIDGRRVADLGIGQYVTATVTAGAHVVHAQLADKRSPGLSLECSGGATVSVLVEPTPGYAGARRQTDWLQLSTTHTSRSRS